MEIQEYHLCDGEDGEKVGGERDSLKESVTSVTISKAIVGSIEGTHCLAAALLFKGSVKRNNLQMHSF